MTRGRWVKSGDLIFYVSCARLCVTDNKQSFNIEMTDGHFKKRIPLLVDKIDNGVIDNWSALFHACNDHDIDGDISKRVFILTPTRKEWIR